MPHSITAVAELDDVLRCDPEPLLRFLHGSRHVWVPSPGRVVLWRDDLDDDGAASSSPLVIGYWVAVLQRSPHLPYLVVSGGRCLVEMFVAACGPGALRADNGTLVVDALVAHATLDEWGRIIRAAAAEYGADPDAVRQHVGDMSTFLRQALEWEWR